MSDSTPRQALGLLADGQELDAMQINDALIQFDAMTDICLLGQFINTPPVAPADGDMYLLGAAPTGAWTGSAYKIAYCVDGAWRFYAPFNGLRAYVTTTHGFLVYMGGAWTDANALISANEVSVASAATCDLGAAGALFVAITGTTAITSFGTAANLLRFVRFAGALSLTYNAGSLILPGAASITTAAGDSAIFASDASGNWRCRDYTRANGVPVAASGITGSGAMVCAGSPAFTGTPVIGTSASQGGLMLNGPASSGNGGVLSLQYGGATKALVGLSSAVTGGTATDLALYSGSAGIKFHAAGAYAGAFDSSGNFLVATSTRIGASSNTAQGHVLAPGYAWFATNDSVYIQRPNGSDGAVLTFLKNGANLGSVSLSGASVVYNTTSDARLKTVTRDQRDYRNAIRDLWVGDFTWKDSGAAGFGVLAQQAHEVMPHHLGVTAPASDDGVWNASAEPFAFLALWGTKDLYALVASLAARVAALEAAHEAG